MRNRKRMLLQQVFWGGLTAVSLLVMFVVVKLAVGRESGQPTGNPRPYTAATDSFLAGFNGITRLAKVPDQRTLELGNGIIKPDHNEDGTGEGTSDNTDSIKPQDNRTDANVQPEPAGEENEDVDTNTASGSDDTEGEESGEEIGEMEPGTDVPAIALTFDDGPFTSVTNRIVDVLLEYDASATFFVVGSRLEMYSDTLKRVYGSGFEVASHTWSHKNLNKLTEEEIIKEIGDTVDELNKYITVENVLLRPPYGNADETVRNLAGTPLINWSLDSQDWKSRDAEKIIAHVLDTVQDGDIILMHDLYESTAKAVEYLVPELIKRGYRLVSVSELFRIKGIPLQEGILYRKPGDHY